MLIANDYNDNRVYIDDTHSNQEYYCPYCGAPLITKKGEIRQHHFAHKQHHLCSDTWEQNHTYDISVWHNEWQSMFPKDNQEVKLALGNIKHRADVMIDRTVIEFQNSIMPVKAFDDRNNFYFNLGNKVIWLFNMSDLMEKQLSYIETDDGLKFLWKNPKKAFNNYDIQSGCIDLFFQLSEDTDKCIVRVTDVSENGFECFFTSKIISKKEFLSWVGLNDGKCLPPCAEDIEEDEQYQAFKEKYQINLNRQQERAMLAIEGSVLLLAVPGSGKTTVLVNRLGHMVINKKIPPTKILAITYTKAAAEEMRERFSTKFGEVFGRQINFRTINSLAFDIYLKYCKLNGIVPRKNIQDEERKRLLRQTFKEIKKKYAHENDILELSTSITYIKNMMLNTEQICELEDEYPNLNAMYEYYQMFLKKERKMDFDDQMVFAYKILQKDESVQNALREQYKYICVDEAQDTSKIQHEIIKILAKGNNVFMVGDEDQSIYGFRAAYPKALLNFRYDYINPYILRMERNYRSTKQIVEKAKGFISQNRGRYEKDMTAERGDGEEVRLEKVSSKEEQYRHLIEIAKKAKAETAFIYRDNESSIVLIDLLLRNNIPFRLRKPEMNFFETKVVKEVVAYLSLAIDEHDADSFDKICNRGIIYLEDTQKQYAIRNCKSRHISIYDAVGEQMQYLKKEERYRANRFRDVMKMVAESNAEDAISILIDNGYGEHLKKEKLDVGKIEILNIIAKNERDIKSFLDRLKEIESKIKQGFDSKEKNAIVLSTIHSSKGMEYETVYMVDVYDGRLPSSKTNIFNRSKDNADGEKEERRLFYVGITRAKNNLNLFSIKDKHSTFIEELFPEEIIKKIKEEEKRAKEREKNIQMYKRNFSPMYSEQELEEIRRDNKRIRELIKEEKIQMGYEEVKNEFVQQEKPIYDSFGNRWIQCEICGEIKTDTGFRWYGGKNKINLGLCHICAEKRDGKIDS